MFRFSKHRLKNGLRVILVPQDTPAVTAQILVGVGSKYESKKLNGIAHVLEHMVFKGTKNWPTAQAISEAVDSVGGKMNAFTGKELTGYWVKTTVQHVDLALKIVADLYQKPLLRAADLNKEKGVILQEIAMYEDLPMQKVEDVLEKLLYGDQAAGRPIIGRPENIISFQASDLKAFRRRHYLPSRTVLTVAGRFKPEKILALIEELFLGQRSRQRAPQRPGVKINQTAPALAIEKKETDQTHFILGFHAVNRFNPRKYPLSLLATILGGGMSSRLFTRIREKEGLAYYIRANNDVNQDTGVLSIAAGVAHENLPKVISLILAELRKIKKKPVSARELRKAKEKMRGEIIMGLETAQSQASFLGQRELFYRSLVAPEEILAKYEKVTATEIQKEAEKIFREDNLNLAIVGPQSQEKIKAILGRQKI